MLKVSKKIAEFSNTLQHYKAEVGRKEGTGQQRIDPPLSALADIASLVHAHTVKIGFAFKAPISIDAAVSTLEDTMKMVPNLAAAYMGMTAELDSKVMVDECQTRIISLYNQMSALMEELKRLVVKAPTATQEEARIEEVTLACINRVLNQSNSVSELKTLGPSGVAAQKLDSMQGLVRDATSELKGWIEDPVDQFDDFGFSDEEEEDGEGEGEEGEEDERTEEDINLAKQWTDRLLKLEYLVKAVKNQRLKSLDVQKLDKVVSQTNQLCASVDNLLSAFLMAEPLKDCPTDIKTNASALLDLAYIEGKEDQFTKWVALFKNNFFKDL